MFDRCRRNPIQIRKETRVRSEECPERGNADGIKIKKWRGAVTVWQCPVVLNDISAERNITAEIVATARTNIAMFHVWKGRYG